MTGDGCILHGATTVKLLDGWTSKENESGFDVVDATFISVFESDLPAKNEDVSSYFGFSVAVVTSSEITVEGNLFVARVSAKGIKTASGYNVRIGSQSQQITVDKPETVGTATVLVKNIYTYHTPTVTISRVDSAQSTLASGEVATPPIVPPITTPPEGDNKTRNIPSGWVVTVEQEGVGSVNLGTAVNVPCWFINEKYSYIHEYAS